jgi:hypothetical protein
MKRRLVACLHADISGYSRLISDAVEDRGRAGLLRIPGRLVGELRTSQDEPVENREPSVSCRAGLCLRLTRSREELTTMRVKESQPQCLNGTIDMPTQSATRSLGRAEAWAASSAAQRFIPERWLIDLLALALAGFLVGAAALYGLAVISTWVPTPNPPTADRLMRGDHEAGAAAFGASRSCSTCEAARTSRQPRSSSRPVRAFRAPRITRVRV